MKLFVFLFCFAVSTELTLGARVIGESLTKRILHLYLQPEQTKNLIGWLMLAAGIMTFILIVNAVFGTDNTLRIKPPLKTFGILCTLLLAMCKYLSEPMKAVFTPYYVLGGLIAAIAISTTSINFFKFFFLEVNDPQ